jgi:hypothetical protein
MNRWRVGEERGSMETDGCPFTHILYHTPDVESPVPFVLHLTSRYVFAKREGQDSSLTMSVVSLIKLSKCSTIVGLSTLHYTC